MSSVVRSTLARISLSNLKPASGSLHNQKRVGRGQGSGYGQKARSGNGKPKAGFEGGQTTILKKFPKRGFVNPNHKSYVAVNLDRLQHWIDQGRLHSTPEKPITARELLLSGCVHNAHDGIKLLGNGAEFLKASVYITPSRASRSAIKAIEANGGTVFCQYYNSLALRDCIKGQTDRVSAAPTLWYTQWRNRGYLSPEAVERMPLVSERWRELSKQLLSFKSQSFSKKPVIQPTE
ncbi:ribosomal protein L15 [Boletus edulis]|nr:ribosomal protein L15 [Boletus edulis]